MNISQTQAALGGTEFETLFAKLYGKENVPAQKERYINLLRQYEKTFGDAQVSLFSAPITTEKFLRQALTLTVCALRRKTMRTLSA